ncbi:hypothetical protein [Bacillus sp. RO1]|uniref:hypothetical protein n=1 Tax=Bacillus sp. RO1 TaxID=2722703 RepID=UPI00145714FC|nr:hypothetical protein [Bacillus sp. RO1]NLP52097.1 hypothetical protein [Bacillus sp. RO1]
MDFDVNTMKRLAAEDKYIEFVFNDLKKRSSDIPEKDIWRIVFDTNVIDDNLYMDTYTKYI